MGAVKRSTTYMDAESSVVVTGEWYEHAGVLVLAAKAWVIVIFMCVLCS